MVIEYTKEERNLIDDCIAYYRVQRLPDYKLDHNDKDTIIEAMEFAHKKGQIIASTDVHAHVLMRSIQRKCGMEVEEPEERQKRLARERYEKRHNIILEAKKKDAEEAGEIYKEKQEEVKQVKAELAQIKTEDEGVAKAVAEAQKKTLEAEQKAQSAQEELDNLKAELAQSKQEAKELKNSKEVIEELAKEEEAEIIENSIPSEEKSLEEKSIAELVEELKTSEKS